MFHPKAIYLVLYLFVLYLPEAGKWELVCDKMCASITPANKTTKTCLPMLRYGSSKSNKSLIRV